MSSLAFSGEPGDFEVRDVFPDLLSLQLIVSDRCFVFSLSLSLTADVTHNYCSLLSEVAGKKGWLLKSPLVGCSAERVLPPHVSPIETHRQFPPLLVFFHDLRGLNSAFFHSEVSVKLIFPQSTSVKKYWLEAKQFHKLTASN